MLTAFAGQLQSALSKTPRPALHGRVMEVAGSVIRAVLPSAKIGELCHLVSPDGDIFSEAEVIGFKMDEALLTPMGSESGLSSTIRVIPTGRAPSVAVGPELLGRTLNGLGHPLDLPEKGPLQLRHSYPLYASPPPPMRRNLISQPIGVGVRAIDALLTCGEGQRIGVFAAAGVGKSTLLGMLVKGTDCDVCVIALIGERGREVREFIEETLDEESRKKSVIIVSTSDRPAMERLKASYTATAIAEYYRDQGKKVLLLMDSVTRFARALREVGLSAGEPPTRRGYPPSVFASLPKLLERAGHSDRGSITAFYTVLVEGDDMTEPVADETRSILDGHIILSRKKAASGHYPAIDIASSVSRVMSSITTEKHRKLANRLRALLAKYEEIELLVQIGEYTKGADPLADEALQKIDKIKNFLTQQVDECPTHQEALDALEEVML